MLLNIRNNVDAFINLNISILENTTFADERVLLSLWPVSSQISEVEKDEEVLVRFEFLNPYPGFVLNSYSGILSTTSTKFLNRESSPKLAMRIVALDEKSGMQLSGWNIQVLVEDINDCAPLFQQSTYKTIVSEETPLGSRILSVKATDADLGMSGVVRYAFDEAVPDFLEINKYDGRITISRVAEVFKRGAEFRFNVVATDRGLYF